MSQSIKIVYFDDDVKDETIKFIKNLLDNYQDEKIKFKKLSAKNQPTVYKDLVKKDSNISDSVFVFGGHGAPKALLVKKSRFYDENSFELGPKCLFAFCCSAAEELGISFANKKNGSFLGFNKKLAFDEDNIFIEWMQKAFYPVISEIFNKESVSEDAYSKAIDELYKAYEYYIGENFLRELCVVGMLHSIRRY